MRLYRTEQHVHTHSSPFPVRYRKSFTRSWSLLSDTAFTYALARQGFFYLGSGDRTQCFSCCSVLRRWQPVDNIEELHREANPRCRLVSVVTWSKKAKNSCLECLCLGINVRVVELRLMVECVETGARLALYCTQSLTSFAGNGGNALVQKHLKDCCWPWGVSRPGAVALATVSSVKAGMKMNEKKVFWSFFFVSVIWTCHFFFPCDKGCTVGDRRLREVRRLNNNFGFDSWLVERCFQTAGWHENMFVS